MKITKGIYTDDLRLDSYEVDPFYHAHTAYYFRVMQEAAGAHAHHKGLSIPHLQKEGKTWVVTRTRMHISHYATWPNTLQVQTWPQQPWKLYFPRVCRLFDHEGTALFESLSHWVVMDLERQRPVKPTSISDRFDMVDTEETVDPDLGKRVVFEPDMCVQTFTYEPKILYSDCDFNRHVNNVRYLEWMLDSLPFDFRDTHLATVVDISYLAQTYRDDTILVNTGVEPQSVWNDGQTTLFHEVVRISKDGERQQVCVASTTWVDRDRFQ